MLLHNTDMTNKHSPTRILLVTFIYFLLLN